MSRLRDDDDPWTYVGLYSPRQIVEVKELLNKLQVKFYEVSVAESEERLKNWTAWDASSCDSKKGHELFIHDDSIEIVGDKIVKMYPERKFGG